MTAVPGYFGWRVTLVIDHQDALALACSIDRSYMGRIERGEASITVEKLYRIASLLNCDPASLLPPMSELQG